MFWKWYFSGELDVYDCLSVKVVVQPTRPGWRDLFKYFDVYFVLSFVSVFIFEVQVEDIADKALLPFSAIFLGLIVAWSGNVSSIIGNEHIYKLSESYELSFEGYVVNFQQSIFHIMIFLLYMCAVVLGAFKSFWGVTIFDFILNGELVRVKVKFFIEIVMYYLFILAIHEAWSIVNAVQSATLMAYRMKKVDEGSAG